MMLLDQPEQIKKIKSPPPKKNFKKDHMYFASNILSADGLATLGATTLMIKFGL